MTFETQGFLSQDVETWRMNFVRANSQWFGIAAKVSETAQKLAFSGDTRDEDKNAERRLLARQLFVRAVSNFQGAVLMAERGMVVEARTLARACLESTFFLGALNNEDYEIVEIMLRDDDNNMRKLARSLSCKPNFREIIGEDTLRKVNHLADAAAKPPSGPKVNYEELARKGDMSDLYEIYRHFSADAAHPTITSLNRYLDPAERQVINSVVFGLDGNVAELSDTISLASNILIAACVAFNQIVGNPNINGDLEEVFEELNQLVKPPFI